MMDATKYAPGYYPVPAGYDSWVKKDQIEKARMTAIINGERVSHEITQKQYDKFHWRLSSEFP